MTWPCYHKRQR